MFSSFEDFKEYGDLAVLILSMVSVAISGFWFGLIYFILTTLDTAFKSTDCIIDNNTLVGTCQELFGLALYPFLNLKDVFIWVSFFFIFALAIGMLVLGYRSGRSPVLLGYSVVMVIVMTYGSIHLSNFYRMMLDNEVFRSMMVEFTVYNVVMLYFPWFIFIITLMSVMLGIVNFQRSNVNSETSDLDY